MKDYCFFLSYASRDRQISAEDRAKEEIIRKDDRIKIFWSDLQKEVNREGGFFDSERIEGRWKADLVDGLAQSRIMVPLFSAEYFKSPNCGKEWQTFRERFDHNEQGQFDSTNAQVSLPVLWKPPVTLPGAAGEFQVRYESFPGAPGEPIDPEYKTKGLEFLLRFKKKAYNRFVWACGQEVIRLADAQGKPRYREVKDWDDILPAFPATEGAGLNFVKFVFLTGTQNEMKLHRPNNYSAYPFFADRHDWRPCFPDLDQHVDDIVTAPAKAGSRIPVLLDPADPNLMAKLKDARHWKNTIVIVVDPWCEKLQVFKDLLQALDREELPNSAVLVNYNTKDPETAGQMDALKQIMQNYFAGRKGRQEYLRDFESVNTRPGAAEEGHEPVEDAIQTRKAYESSVLEAFSAVRARLVERGDLPGAGGEPAAAVVIRNATN